MLRVGVLLRVASAGAATAPQASRPTQLRVIVLSMVPNGGAMTEALRILGYNPYNFELSIRKGGILTHPQEWVSVLRREKPFNFDILKIPELAADAAGGKAKRKNDNTPPPPPRYYDSLVGPPATIAFEAILKECPRSTRVILVEEPDKLAWEKDMDQWLRPLAVRCEKSTRWGQTPHLHMMLQDMVDLRRALIDPADVRKGRVRLLASSSAAAMAQNVPLAHQQTTLRLSGALDLFEQHVKEVVPPERLLVYRVQEGWKPLCDFLHVPVPTTAASSSSSAPADAAADASGEGRATSVTAPNEPIPFPPNSNGSDVLTFINQGVLKANAVGFLFLLSAAALALLVLASFRDELRSFHSDYRSYILQDLEPYLEEERRTRESGGESQLTAHKALVIAKRSTHRFGQEYEKEGGAAKSMTGVLRRFIGMPDAEAPPLPPPATTITAASVASTNRNEGKL
jgi:hypothetical protein